MSIHLRKEGVVLLQFNRRVGKVDMHVMRRIAPTANVSENHKI